MSSSHKPQIRSLVDNVLGNIFPARFLKPGTVPMAGFPEAALRNSTDR